MSLPEKTLQHSIERDKPKTFARRLERNFESLNTRTEALERKGSTSVASAATVTLPSDAPLVSITGTTNITSVTAKRAGTIVVLVFAGALTFTDGSNLVLAGNFVTTANDTITLISDGTNWIEIARSVN